MASLWGLSRRYLVHRFDIGRGEMLGLKLMREERREHQGRRGGIHVIFTSFNYGRQNGPPGHLPNLL